MPNEAVAVNTTLYPEQIEVSEAETFTASVQLWAYAANENIKQAKISKHLFIV